MTLPAPEWINAENFIYFCLSGICIFIVLLIIGVGIMLYNDLTEPAFEIISEKDFWTKTIKYPTGNQFVDARIECEQQKPSAL